MPLSKARMRERKRLDRVKPKSNLIPQVIVKPNTFNPPVVSPFEPLYNVKPIEDVRPIGMPVRPTAQQKAEWAKFKQSQY